MFLLFSAGANVCLDALRKIQPNNLLHNISKNLPCISFTTSGLKKIGSATLELSNSPTKGIHKPINKRSIHFYININLYLCTNVHKKTTQLHIYYTFIHLFYLLFTYFTIIKIYYQTITISISMFYNEKNTNQIRLNNFLIKNVTTTYTNLHT